MHTTETKIRISKKQKANWADPDFRRAQLANKKRFEFPTSLESRLARLLDEDWIYVGDRSVWIGKEKGFIGCNPDFINYSLKTVIEVYDPYWKEHKFGSVEKWIERKKEVYDKAGWNSIFISEEELYKLEAKCAS